MKQVLVIRITREGERYIALGREIDYMAQGRSVVEVLGNFSTGFNATVDEHIKVYGNVSNFFRPTPEDGYGTLNDEYVGTIEVEINAENHLVGIE